MGGCQPGIGGERTRSPSAILPTKEMSAATVGGTKPSERPWTDAKPYTLLNDARVAVMGAPRGCDRYSESTPLFFCRVQLTKRLRSAAQSNPTCIRRGGLKVADRR